MSVAAVDWTDAASIAAALDEGVGGPYELILAADCVYNEQAVPHFLAAITALAAPRAHILIANEFRSQSVHDVFMAGARDCLSLRRVAQGRLHPDFEHPLIHLYHARPLRAVETPSPEADTQEDAPGTLDGQASPADEATPATAAATATPPTSATS